MVIRKITEREEIQALYWILSGFKLLIYNEFPEEGLKLSVHKVIVLSFFILSNFLTFLIFATLPTSNIILTREDSTYTIALKEGTPIESYIPSIILLLLMLLLWIYSFPTN